MTYTDANHGADLPADPCPDDEGSGSDGSDNGASLVSSATTLLVVCLAASAASLALAV